MYKGKKILKKEKIEIDFAILTGVIRYHMYSVQSHIQDEFKWCTGN